MHINYRELLPLSSSCDHLQVNWSINEPQKETYVLVSVSCKTCPTSVTDVKVQKR